MSYVKGLVDLVLHGQAVAVPPEAALHVVAGLVGVACHDVLHVKTGREKESNLDGACKDVAIVGSSGGKGRPIVEGVSSQSNSDQVLYSGRPSENAREDSKALMLSQYFRISTSAAGKLKSEGVSHSKLRCTFFGLLILALLLFGSLCLALSL